MHVLISLENVSRNFSPNWPSLDQLCEAVKTLFPNEKVEVHVEFSLAHTYEVITPLREIRHKGPEIIRISPRDRVDSSMINPRISEYAVWIASLVVLLLIRSDEERDILEPVQVHISDGLQTYRYLNDKRVDSF